MENSKKDFSFEKGIERLENIVHTLEKGEIEIDKALELFEEGIGLTKNCNNKLEAIENKITILIQEDGNMKEQKFDINGDEKEYGI